MYLKIIPVTIVNYALSLALCLSLPSVKIYICIWADLPTALKPDISQTASFSAATAWRAPKRTSGRAPAGLINHEKMSEASSRGQGASRDAECIPSVEELVSLLGCSVCLEFPD